MRVPLSILPACLLCASAPLPGRASNGDYAPPPFDHYQPILDRMPFGTLPDNFGQAAASPVPDQSAAQVQAEQQKLAQQVNMSAVNITPDGQTAIGFTDLSAKPPVSHFLLVGASAGGWTVVSADYDDETASLMKDGVTITLKLGKGLIDPSAQPPKEPGAAAGVPAPSPLPGVRSVTRRSPAAPGAPVAKPAGLAARVSPLPLPRGLAPAPAPAPAGAEAEERSYADRLRERESQKTAEQLAAAKRQQAQLEKIALAAAQREIERREEEATRAAAEEALQPEEPPMAPAVPEAHPFIEEGGVE